MKEFCISRRDYLKITGTSLAYLITSDFAAGAEPNGAGSPNLLFIFSDQQRRQALGFWSTQEYKDALNGVGDPVLTPNLDKLAGESIVFNQAMSTYPVCSPYRAMMLSGMFPERNGVNQNCRGGIVDGLKLDARCITDVLLEQGYNTAFFGKAHFHRTEPLFDKAGIFVGSKKPPGGHYADSFDTYVPPGAARHGIEYWYQSLGNQHSKPEVYSSDPEAIAGKKDGEQHLPGVFSSQNEANLIINYLQNKRDKTKPFCLIWAPNPPHHSFICPDKSSTVPYKDADVKTLLNRPNLNAETEKGKESTKGVQGYFSLVTALDKQVGRVLDELEAAGLADNTIVVFTSDHGEMMGSQGLMHKNVEYEESAGIPFLLRYPAKLKHRIEPLLLGSTDIMPTLLGLMGYADKIPERVQGADYSTLLRDPKGQQRPSSTLLIPGGRKGIRTDRYTFTVGVDKASELKMKLFDNIKDPYQMNNLTLGEIPKEDQLMLRKELGSWLARAEDVWHRDKQHADIIIYPEKSAEKIGQM